MKIYFLITFTYVLNLSLAAQNVAIIATHPNNTISFRGLSIQDNTIWVSGSQGTVGKSTDGGKTWEWHTVPGYEKNDFRDIEAISKTDAIIMAISSPAYILKTDNGGITWRTVFEDKDSAMFLDAMAFKNNRKGIVIGDPVGNRFFVATTTNGGNSWQKDHHPDTPAPISGEAFFAASGSNIAWFGSRFFIVSGGVVSRFLSKKFSTALPLTQGQTMTGANSIAIKRNVILVAAGNYNAPNNSDSVFCYSSDNGKSWQLPQTMPSGYKSCVCFIGKNKAISCGITGVDISTDNGKNWKKISNESFNTCVFHKKENAVYFVGNKGRLGKLLL